MFGEVESRDDQVEEERMRVIDRDIREQSKKKKSKNIWGRGSAKLMNRPRDEGK